jgi:hypothetical protein
MSAITGWLALTAVAIAVVVELLKFWKLKLENKLLKIKLRRALKDVRAFHMLETLYCEEASDGGLAFPRSFVSPLSIKRAMRAKLRAGGTETPSEHATPHQIAQQLEGL